MINKTTCTSSYYFDPFWLQNEWIQCEIVGTEQIQWRSSKQLTLKEIKREFIEEKKQRIIDSIDGLSKAIIEKYGRDYLIKHTLDLHGITL